MSRETMNTAARDVLRLHKGQRNKWFDDVCRRVIEERNSQTKMSTKEHKIC